MRKEVIGAVVAVAVVLAFAGGIVVSPSILRTNDIATTTQAQRAEVTCPIAKGGTVVLSVVNSSDRSPIASVPVRVTWVTNLCAPTFVTADLGYYMTNSSGQIELREPRGSYTINVTYMGRYSAQVLVPDVNATVMVELGIPGGEMSETCIPANNMC
jgi:hypothetical protein